MTAASIWFMKRMPRPRECPARATAWPLSCGETSQPASVDWRVPAIGGATARPDDDGPHLAGFVWCAGADARAVDDLYDQLNEMAHARQSCGAYPWELAGGMTPDQNRARETLWHLSLARHIKDESGWDRAVAQARRAPWFDEKTAEAMRQLETSDVKSMVQAHRALSERIGAAPDGRCETVSIENVRRVDGLRPHGDLAFSVTMNETGDFAPLGAFLCRAGCTLSVLPVAADDPRVGFCR